MDDTFTVIRKLVIDVLHGRLNGQNTDRFCSANVRYFLHTGDLVSSVGVSASIDDNSTRNMNETCETFAETVSY